MNNLETHLSTKERQTRRVLDTSWVTRNASGVVTGYTTERVRLEKKLKDSFQQIKDTQSAAILGFARLTEYRDRDTGKHLERIREYTRVLAIGLARLPKYADYISADYVEDLCLSSVLHSVGKVGIEDALLLKPGRLDKAEFERMKLHATLGGGKPSGRWTGRSGGNRPSP